MLLGGGAWREWVVGKVQKFSGCLTRIHLKFWRTCTRTGLNLPGQTDGPGAYVATWPCTAHAHLKLVNSFKASVLVRQLLPAWCFSLVLVLIKTALILVLVLITNVNYALLKCISVSVSVN